MSPSNKNSSSQSIIRVRIWYGILLFVVCIFLLRLFYIQVIRYGYYKTAALSDQLKQYEIPAERGTIEAHSGNDVLPLVLNQELYVLYGDPTLVKKPAETAAKIQAVIGGDAAKNTKLLEQKKLRYVILGKKLDKAQKKQVLALKLPGIGAQAQSYRTYPQNNLASQLLGFVDDEGKGKYGIEQALNDKLKGIPGQMKAITDASGIPLAASKDNTQIQPINGSKLVLTIDLPMQQQLENIIAQGMKDSRSSGVSAVIMDPNSGAVKAMANVPTYDPSKYFEVEDGNLFQNAAVSKPIEVGSTMKTLTTAAALDKGVVNANTSYYDPSFWKVDDFKITNIEEDGGAGSRNIADILNLSLNTGAVWELMQMGGGSINQRAREAWYDYLTNHYMFGKATGIEQGYESAGLVPKPEDNGAGINLTYANTSFGQAMTATPIQMAAALSAVVNGGKYYKPYLLDSWKSNTGASVTNEPKVIKQNVVSPETSAAMIPLMQNVVNKHHIVPPFDQNMYTVGGKTGTAQIDKPGGGYYEDRFNGTYLGFVGGDNVQYVIAVFVDKPTNGGYAGTAAAQPIFGKLAHMLIDNSYVTPKGQ